MIISIGKVSRLLGISLSTLRRWEKYDILYPAFRTLGKHRRYKLDEILEMTGEKINSNRIAIGYARVICHKKKNELQTQKRVL